MSQSDKNGAAEIVRQYRRQNELSPGVGEAAQRYGLAVCDDILNDLARSAIGETHTDHPARHYDRTCPACVSEIARTCPKCGETKPCGFQGCHMESALSAEVERTPDAYLVRSRGRNGHYSECAFVFSDDAEEDARGWRMIGRSTEILPLYLKSALSATVASEYICKCGIRVSPHRCGDSTEF